MKYRKIIIGNLIFLVLVNFLVIYLFKSYIGYVEIRFVCVWGLVCLLRCLNLIIESFLVSIVRKIVIGKNKENNEVFFRRVWFICWWVVTKEGNIEECKYISSIF